MVTSVVASAAAIKRPTANYHPCVWKNHFLSLDSTQLKIDDDIVKQGEQLKERVRKMLIAYVENPSEKLILVDSIQRLGVFYHFEDEINEVLEKIYQTYDNNMSSAGAENLYIVALRFRLLRQQGYKISCDIFKKYTDSKEKFEKSVGKDVKSLVSLYEATHMRVHGEDILEEALDFTTTHLKAIVENLNEPLRTEVRDALKQPLRKGLPRVKARQYMFIYEEDPSHNHSLITFAKLDFNILQKIHQNELKNISRWWKDLNFATKLPFARDRIVECYFWILGVYFEPHFNVARKILTKVIVLTSVLDDIFDAYGTFEELQLFTTATLRWDTSMLNELPEYMKIFYTALLNLFEEIERDVGKDGRSYRIHFAKEAMKKQVVSYFHEAEWLHKSYKPTFEEYMNVALISSGYVLLSTISFLGMGDIVTKEIFEWVEKGPKIIQSSAIIARLMDDIVSRKVEKERGHITTAVECYMETYGGSEEEICVELNKQVVNAWKDINEACLQPRDDVPMPILMCVVNLSRVIDLLYSDGDGYTNAKGRTKFLINSMLVDPMPCSEM